MVQRSRSRRNAQSAFEFLFLLLFVILVASLITVAVQQNLEREIERVDNQIVDEYREIWEEEVRMASVGGEQYLRTFQVPSNPRGFNLISSFGENASNVSDELILSYKGEENLFFLPTKINYDALGQNTSMADGIRVSRRCYDSCEIQVFNGSDVAQGVSNKTFDNLTTTVNKPRTLTGEWPYLYASGQNDFWVLNVSNPENIKDLGNISAAGSAQFGHITTSLRSYAVPTETSGKEVQLYNLTNPGDFDELGTITSPLGDSGNKPRKMIIEYPIGFIVESKKLHTVWLENASGPNHMVNTSVAGNPDMKGGTYAKHGAIYATSDNGIEVFDVTDKLDPVHQGSELSSSVNHVLFEEGVLYAVKDNEVATYEVSDPNNFPSSDSSSEAITDGNGVRGSLWRDYLFVATSKGYRIYDVSDPTDIRQVGRGAGSTTLKGIHATHDALYTIDDNKNVVAWD